MKISNFFYFGSNIGLLVFILVFTFYGCKNEPEKEKQDAEEVVDTMLTKENAIKEISEYPLPTSFEVTKMLYEAGASYIFGISNPVENADKYFTQKSKALNLGIYGADLSYSSIYDMKQETMLFLMASKKLIDELSIISAFNRFLVERIEVNIDSKDSLVQIISDSFYDTYKYLYKNEQNNLSLLVIAGSWIEGVFITSQIALFAEKNEVFLKILASQKDPLNKLIELMEPIKEDPNITEVYTDLNKLKILFAEVGETLTEKQLDDITNNIEPIRNKIVQ